MTLRSITGSSNLCQCIQQPVVPLYQSGILDNVNVMHQKIRNQEDNTATSTPVTKQHQREKKTLDVLTRNEQQEQSEVEEGIEIHGGAQAETKKNQRGSYRQYEDANVILENIRYYRIQRHPDSEIMKLLDNMPRRTYYNYVKKLQEQERQITEQWISEHVEHYAEELMIYRETLCQKLREIQGIIDNKNTPPREKMQAIAQYLAITDKLVNFERNGRVEAMKYAKQYVSTSY